MVVAVGQYDQVGALTSFTVNTTLRHTVRAVADGTELYRPPLPANNMALAVKIGELIAEEVAAAVVGGL